MRDLGIVAAKHMPEVDVILIEVPDEIGGYGAKGVGEIGCVATAPAVAAALHSYDGIRRFRLPMDDAPAAGPSVPKSRRKSRFERSVSATAQAHRADLAWGLPDCGPCRGHGTFRRSG